MLCPRTSACFLAIAAQRHAAKRADDADERFAIGTRIPFGGALLIPAKPANHGVPFAELLSHIVYRLAARIKRGSNKGPSAESTSGSAFNNAPRALQPGGHPVRVGLVPTFRHGRQSSLLSLTLEAEPAVDVLARDRNRSSKWSAPPVRGPTAVQLSDIRSVRGRARGGPAIDLSSLGRGRRNQPHFPPSARRVEKRSIIHRQVLRREWCAKVCAHHSNKHGGCQNRAGGRPVVMQFRKRTYMSPFG